MRSAEVHQDGREPLEERLRELDLSSWKKGRLWGDLPTAWRTCGEGEPHGGACGMRDRRRKLKQGVDTRYKVKRFPCEDRQAAAQSDSVFSTLGAFQNGAG